MSAIGEVTAAININRQDPLNGITTRLRVDDAFAGQAVPEPSTLLLLGSGLVGRVAFGRKRAQK